MTDLGIYVTSNGHYSVVSWNLISVIDADTVGSVYGIHVAGDYSTITGNGVYSCRNTYNDAIGIDIEGDYCIVFGNVAIDNEINFDKSSTTGVIGDENNNIFA